MTARTQPQTQSRPAMLEQLAARNPIRTLDLGGLAAANRAGNDAAEQKQGPCAGPITGTRAPPRPGNAPWFR